MSFSIAEAPKNSKSLRRLATEHGSLHTAGLPPNYLFPPTALSDDSDLTSLDVLLAGPVGTPYAKGVWRLHLEIPHTYPSAPPTATFRTRLWHPNIDEATGAVCVETLKRDWTSNLKLRDVLITISCLLIQPNPASALNEDAGKMANEDWNGFCRRASLMTEIHAAVPQDLATEVKDAQMRGEEVEVEKGTKSGDVKGQAEASTSAAKKKVQQNLVAHPEDEENLRRRGDTVEVQSDPESDWIPGPRSRTSPGPFAASRDNILGIKGLDDSMQIDSSPEKVTSSTLEHSSDQRGPQENDDSDPFIMPSQLGSPKDNVRDTPDLLKFSTQNPFSAIQPNNQQDRVLKEFSYSWEDSEIMRETKSIPDGPSKDELRKRMASPEFEEKREWEMKKFKKTGYDLKKYNRGDFGPHTGLGRL